MSRNEFQLISQNRLNFGISVVDFLCVAFVCNNHKAQACEHYSVDFC